ncbi:MAG: L,D-transpeptidase family protein [Cyanobacteria bacterium SID2]|nr:L,D-transpeptidase family protein [Cyanobacteria bacterium SID2]MBP0003827.1 L,D-transpeptidase family protein [Cyanobacteria bacterium SBC]
MVQNGAIANSIAFVCFSSAALLVALQVRPLSRPVRSISTLSTPIAPETTVRSKVLLTTNPSTSEATKTTPKLVVDLSDRTVSFYQGNRLERQYPIAVGQPGWETPTGTFTVLDKIAYPTWQHPITGARIPPGRDNPLGDRWIGFWTDGTHQIGFHGTPDESLVGQAVSHGCLRMRNAHIRELFDRIEIGTLTLVKP